MSPQPEFGHVSYQMVITTLRLTTHIAGKRACHQSQNLCHVSYPMVISTLRHTTHHAGSRACTTTATAQSYILSNDIYQHTKIDHPYGYVTTARIRLSILPNLNQHITRAHILYVHGHTCITTARIRHSILPNGN